MPGGRPTSYRPEFCEQVIDLGKEGKSVAQMCAHFGITRSTIDDWAAAHPEFSEAYTQARVEMQAKLEEMGFDGLKSKDFNAPLWKTMMQARFRDDYTERRVNEHTGKDGGPIQTEEVSEGAKRFRSTVASLASRSGENSGDQ